MLKIFERFRKKEQAPQLIWREPEGCFATKRMVNGRKVGYMYREQTDSRFPDSGWRFFEGSEDDAHMSDAENTRIYQIQTICRLDPAIVPYMHAPHGTAWERNADGTFTEVPFEPPEED